MEHGKGKDFEADGQKYVERTFTKGVVNKEKEIYAWTDGVHTLTYMTFRRKIGTYIFPDNSKYKGQWLNHEYQDDDGEYTWPNGYHYKGGFEKGQIHGHGVYTWADGTKFDGEHIEGKRKGNGKIIYPNQESYDGMWDDDKMNGPGTYEWPELGKKYSGHFIGNIMFTGKWRKSLM